MREELRECAGSSDVCDSGAVRTTWWTLYSRSSPLSDFSCACCCRSTETTPASSGRLSRLCPSRGSWPRAPVVCDVTVLLACVRSTDNPDERDVHARPFLLLSALFSPHASNGRPDSAAAQELPGHSAPPRPARLQHGSCRRRSRTPETLGALTTTSASGNILLPCSGCCSRPRFASLCGTYGHDHDDVDRAVRDRSMPGTARSTLSMATPYFGRWSRGGGGSDAPPASISEWRVGLAAGPA